MSTTLNIAVSNDAIQDFVNQALELIEGQSQSLDLNLSSLPTIMTWSNPLDALKRGSIRRDHGGWQK